MMEVLSRSKSRRASVYIALTEHDRMIKVVLQSSLEVQESGLVLITGQLVGQQSLC